MTGRPWLAARGARAARTIGAVDADGALTYAELHARRATPPRRCGAGRRAGRPRRRSRCRPGVDFVVALHACLLLGAAVVPVDLRLRPPSGARAPARARRRRAAARDGRRRRARRAHDLDATAIVVHTSGTTGRAQAGRADLRQLALERAGLGARARRSTRDERWLCTLPLSHVGGLAILLRSAIYGTTAVVHERFDADPRWRRSSATASRSSRSCRRCSRALLDAGLRAPHRAARARWSAAARCRPALLERAAAAGVPVAQTYGHDRGLLAGHDRCRASRRRRAARCSARASGSPTTARSSSRPDGRARRAARTAGCTRATSARSTRAGACTSPAASPTRSSPAARTSRRRRSRRCCSRIRRSPTPPSTAAPTREWGEAVAATRRAARRRRRRADELRALCAARLARFKVPEGDRFADALPRTPSGKLLRRELGMSLPR